MLRLRLSMTNALSMTNVRAFIMLNAVKHLQKVQQHPHSFFASVGHKKVGLGSMGRVFLTYWGCFGCASA